nr:RNase H-like domain-containing protein [Nostoc sp. DedSLP05]
MAVDARSSDTESESDDEEPTATLQNPDSNSPTLDEQPSPSFEAGQPSVSLSAMVGMDRLDTFKFFGFVKKAQALVLIDPGSTLNIIDKKYAKRLRLSVDPTEKFPIQIPGHHQIPCEGVVHNLELQTPSCTLKEDFFVVDIGGVDIVLGVQWLYSLGTYCTNHQERTLTFLKDGEELTIKALPAKDIKVVDSKHMSKLLKKGHFGFMARLYCMDIMSANQKEMLGVDALLQKYERVFQDLPKELPPDRGLEHVIELDPTKGPVVVRPYRYGHNQKTEIERLIQELLDAGIIVHSKSPYAAPVVLARKKDGSLWLCIDYRELNRITIKDKFPMPRIDDLLDELHGAKYFSKIDLRSGYYQIPVRVSDQAKTAFRTHQGHFEFRVMPFGLSNAPATFQALMNKIFGKYLRQFILVFFDDILIYSKSLEEHLHHLDTTLNILAEWKLYAKRSKCTFASQSLEYLGHIISVDGVHMDPDKIIAIQEWPVPRTLKKLRGFLGLAGFYRRFVRNFSSIAHPLTDLTKKNSFMWSNEAQLAFDSLKQALSSAPVLTTPDFSSPFVIECDASGSGLGAVLTQRGRPLAFESKKLTDTEKRLSTYSKEMLAILHAIRKWRQFLFGAKFFIKTDHLSLKHLLTQGTLIEEQQKWVDQLQAYDFEIIYKKGTDNIVANALSRRDEPPILNNISTCQPTWITELRADYDKDASTIHLQHEILAGKKDSAWEVSNGLILFKGKIYLRKDSPFCQKALQYGHSSTSAGHIGFTKTYRKISSTFFWPKMKQQIEQYVRECDICQRNKVESVPSPGLLHPHSIPNQKWEVISMDFITGLPRSEGKDAVFVVVDKLTKYAHFIPLTTKFSAPAIAELFFSNVYKLHGIPHSIICDRDPKFLSNFWQELFRLAGVTFNMSSAYHPQTDGQTEIVNKCLEGYLRMYTGDKQCRWMKWLHLAEYWYNTTYHTAIKMSPFKALYGYDPPSPRDWISTDIRVAAAGDVIEETLETMRSLKENLQMAVNRMKQQADQHRTERTFEVGDMVFVRLQPYKQTTLKIAGKQKLHPKFYGPYKIRQKISDVAYALDIPNRGRLHDVFHVSCLKKQVGQGSSTQTEIPITDEEGRFVLEPECILEIASRQLRNRTTTRYKVKWKGMPPEDATWENEEFIKSHPTLGGQT